MYYLCSENKGVISFAVTAKLICVFVFTYAKCWFSQDAAYIHFSCYKTLHQQIMQISSEVRFGTIRHTPMNTMEQLITTRTKQVQHICQSLTNLVTLCQSRVLSIPGIPCLTHKGPRKQTTKSCQQNFNKKNQFKLYYVEIQRLEGKHCRSR